MVDTASVGHFQAFGCRGRPCCLAADTPPRRATAATTPTPSAPSSNPRRVMSVCPPSPADGRGVPWLLGAPPESPMPPSPGVPESGVGVAVPTYMPASREPTLRTAPPRVALPRPAGPRPATGRALACVPRLRPAETLLREAACERAAAPRAGRAGLPAPLFARGVWEGRCDVPPEDVLRVTMAVIMSFRQQGRSGLTSLVTINPNTIHPACPRGTRRTSTWTVLPKE